MKKVFCILMIFWSWQVEAQEYAPNDIPIPWYSQKLDICDTWHLCGLASTLMITDYYDNLERTNSGLQTHMQQINAHFNKPNCTSNYPEGDIVALAQYKNYPIIENGFSASKDYNIIMNAINQGFPVIVMINYAGVDHGGGMSPGGCAHWIVVRGINSSHIWINNPGTTYVNKGRNKCFPKGAGTNFHSCWTGKYIIIHGNRNLINDNVEIYAGSHTSPKQFKIWFNLNNVTNSFSVLHFKIGTTTINPSIAIQPYANGRSSFIVTLSSNQLTTLKDTLYNLSFDINSTANHFSSQYRLSFIDPEQLEDVDEEDWFKSYVYDGVNNGFYRGKIWTSFTPGDNLNKAQMAKVVVMAALKLNLYEINTATNINGYFQDVPPSDWAFPYVQTLRNRGDIVANTNYYPENSITAGQFAKILCNGLNLNESDINEGLLNGGQGTTGSKINHTASDPNLQTYIDRINEIIVLKTVSANFKKAEPLASGLFSVSYADIENFEIIADGSNTVTRALMSKVLYNAFHFKQNGNSKSTTALGNYTVIGDKFELTPNPSGGSPVSVSGNINMIGGESRDLGFSNSYLNGDPLYFYWTVDGGNLVSLYSNHRKVRFTAPIVSSVTNYHLYFLCGTASGKINEAFVTINVIPVGSGGTTVYPLQQASDLNIIASDITSAYLNWTRGDGDHCIVTCDNNGNTNSPEANHVYSGNSNLALSPIINGSTKVVYTGNSNNVEVTGLTVGETYVFRVYEFNGSTTANVKYLLDDPATQSYYTNNTDPLIVDYAWNPYTITQGQPITFYNTSSNFTSVLWSFEGANIINSTNNLVTNVIFANAGEYEVRLDAINSVTGESNYESKLLTVYSPTQFLPDLLIQSLVVNPTSILTNNRNAWVTCDFTNNGVNSANNFYAGVYLSTDNSLSANDVLLVQEQFGSIGNSDEGLISTNISIPSNIPAGTYYIIVKLDNTGVVTETFESNNSSYIQIVLLNALPDMIIQSMSVNPATLSSESNVTVNAILQNIGTAATYTSGISTVQLIFSTDNVISADDIIHNQAIYYGNSINPNQTVTATGNIPLPQGIPDGNYFIIGKVNYSNDEELNYNNNIGSTAISIYSPTQPTIQASNLSISNITNNSVRLAWTNGNGQARIAIASEQVCRVPNDGIAYSSNSYFPSAPIISSGTRVVYNGNGNYVDITGLTANTTYYFSVIEYNGTGSQTNYLQVPASITSISGQQVFSVATASPIINNGWEKQTVLSGFNDVCFVNESVGYGAMTWGRFCKTTDGGKTWRLKQISISSTADLTTLFFIDSNIGWVAGSNNGVIWKTTDGGNTFTPQTSNTSRIISDIFFVDQLLGFAVFQDEYPTFDKTGAILKTIDGGNTWMLNYQSPQRLFSVYFVNENTGWSVGRYGIVLKTIDGGNNWMTLVPGLSINSSLNSCYFIDSNTGFVSGFGGGKILKTSDGGSTWSIVKGAGNDLVNSIHFANTMVGYAVGGVQIHKTIDGGFTWESSTIVENSLSVFCLTPNKIFIGCEDGLLKSNSGGQAQFISAPAITQTHFCTPSNVVLPFTSTGNFNSGNTFRAEISDSAGSFCNPFILGELNGTNSGSIYGFLPLGLQNGDNYKVRIVSTNPSIIGEESNVLSITQTPVAVITGIDDIYLTTSPAFQIESHGAPFGGVFRVDGTITSIFDPGFLSIGDHSITYAYSTGDPVLSSNPPVGVFTNCIAQNSYYNNCFNGQLYNYIGGIIRIKVNSIDKNGDLSLTITKCSGGTFSTGGNFSIRDLDDMLCWNITVNSGVSSIDLIINIGSPIGVHRFVGLFNSSNSFFYHTGEFEITGIMNPVCSDSTEHFFSIEEPRSIIMYGTNGTTFCAGYSIQTAFTTQGIFEPNNEFILELSDPNGSFANPIPIGTHLGTTGTTLLDSLPVTLAQGNNYKVRVKSTHPPVTGTESSPFTVNSVTVNSVSILVTDTLICNGEPVTFTAVPINGGAPAYWWNVNGSIVGYNSPVYNSSSLQNGDIVSVQMASSLNCPYPYIASSSSFEMYVQDNEIPTAYIESDLSQLCANSPLSCWAYTDYDGNNPQYTWYVNGINVGNDFVYLDLDTLTTNAEISFLMHSDAECLITDTAYSNQIQIIVDPLPFNAGLISGNNVVCAGQSVITYSILPISNASSYVWTLPSGATGASTTNTISVTYGNNAVSGVISVKGINGCGEGQPSFLPISVMQPPSVNVGPDQNVMQGNSITLTAVVTGGLSPYYYVWSNGSITQSITVSPATSTLFSVTVTDANGCQSIDDVFITVTAGVTIVTSIPNVQSCPANITVPINVTNFNGVASLTLVFSYNNQNLTYNGFQNVNTNITPGALLVNGVNGNVMMAYYSLNPINIGNGVLVEIKFTSNGNGSDLIWNQTDPENCTYTSMNGMPIPASFINGSVSILGCSTVSGTVTYANSTSTPMTNSTIKLYQNQVLVGQSGTNTSGYYSIGNIRDGISTIPNGITNKPWGGVNSADALAIMRHFVGIAPLSGIKVKAADVNGSNTINANDALLVSKRFVNQITYFPVGDWVFDKTAFIVNGNTTRNILALCYGDANGSFIPNISLKGQGTPIKTTEEIVVSTDGVFDIPVFVENSTSTSAISLVISTIDDKNKLLDIFPINLPVDDNSSFLTYKIEDSHLRMSWFSISPVFLDETIPIFRIIAELNGRAPVETSYLIMESETDFADETGRSISDVSLTVPKLILQQLDFNFECCFPNPAGDKTEMSYSIPENGSVKVVLYNYLGQQMSVLKDEKESKGEHLLNFPTCGYKNGVYLVRVEFTTESGQFTKTARIVISN